MNLWPTVAAGIIFIAILFIVGYAFEAFLRMVDSNVGHDRVRVVDDGDDEDEVYHRYYSGNY